MSDVRRQKAEGRRQKAEGRRQKAEGRRRIWGIVDKRIVCLVFSCPFVTFGFLWLLLL
jgi:hypothetical protein